MNWICYLVDQIARFRGGNDSSFVNFQSNLNNPPLKNVDGIKGRLFIIALFSIHSELLTKEDAVKVLQVVDDAVASEFVKKIIGAMARAARVGMQKPNEQQTTASAERTDGDRSGYELPEELKGLFVVYNKLVQFIRDSHIDPIRKPNSSSLLPSVFLADDSPFLLCTAGAPTAQFGFASAPVCSTVLAHACACRGDPPAPIRPSPCISASMCEPGFG